MQIKNFYYDGEVPPFYLKNWKNRSNLGIFEKVLVHYMHPDMHHNDIFCYQKQFYKIKNSGHDGRVHPFDLKNWKK